MATDFRKKHGMVGYVEASAKSGENIKDVFFNKL